MAKSRNKGSSKFKRFLAGTIGTLFIGTSVVGIGYATNENFKNKIDTIRNKIVSHFKDSKQSLKTRIDELIKKIENLTAKNEEDIKNYTAQIENLQAEKTTLESEKESLQKELAEKQARLEELEAQGVLDSEEVERLNKEIIAINNRINELEARVSALENQEISLRNTIAELEKTLDDLNLEVDKLWNIFENYQDYVESTENGETVEVELTEEEKQIIEEKIEELENEVINKTNDITDLETQKTEIQNNINDLTNEKTEVENNINDYQEQRNEINNDITELDSTNQNIQTTINSNNEVIEELESLGSEITEEQQTQLDNLKTENETLHTQINNNNTLISTKRVLLTSIQLDINNANIELDSLEARIELLETNYSALDLQVQALNRDITGLQNQINSFDKFLKKANGEEHIHIQSESIENYKETVITEKDKVATYDKVITCNECNEEISRETITELIHTPSFEIVENFNDTETLTTYDIVKYCEGCNEIVSKESIVFDKTAPEDTVTIYGEFENELPYVDMQSEESITTALAESSFDYGVACGEFMTGLGTELNASSHIIATKGNKIYYILLFNDIATSRNIFNQMYLTLKIDAKMPITGTVNCGKLVIFEYLKTEVEHECSTYGEFRINYSDTETAITYDKVSYCMVCGENTLIETVVEEKHIHTAGNYEYINKVETETGYTETFVVYCSDCNEVMIEKDASYSKISDDLEVYGTPATELPYSEFTSEEAILNYFKANGYECGYAVIEETNFEEESNIFARNNDYHYSIIIYNSDDSEYLCSEFMYDLEDYHYIDVISYVRYGNIVIKEYKNLNNCENNDHYTGYYDYIINCNNQAVPITYDCVTYCLLCGNEVERETRENPVKQISFTIDGVSYNALNNMTFKEWLVSDYSNNEFEWNQCIVKKGTLSCIYSDNTLITEHYSIVDGENYTLSTGLSTEINEGEIAFRVGDKVFKATEGMTWEEFLNSEYNDSSIEIVNNSSSFMTWRNGVIYNSNGGIESPTDTINDNAVYELLGTVKFNDTPYLKPYGCSWLVWLNSKYCTDEKFGSKDGYLTYEDYYVYCDWGFVEIFGCSQINLYYIDYTDEIAELKFDGHLYSYKKGSTFGELIENNSMFNSWYKFTELGLTYKGTNLILCNNENVPVTAETIIDENIIYKRVEVDTES